MKQMYFSVLSLFLFGIGAHAQSFTNVTGELPDSFNSGGCVGVTDMNNDGLDDIIVLHNSKELYVLYQGANGFSMVDYGNVSGSNQWGFAIGDMNNDGHNDVISGGSYDGVHYVSIDGIGDYNMVNLSNGSMFMQACNVVDIDNDGMLDYFACHDDGLSRMWRNDGAGSLVPANDLFDLTNYDTGAFPNTDHSGNYGSVWSDIDGDGDLDLVIAKCRQFVSNPFDPRRINQAWINDGQGNFTEEALDRGLVFYEQSWTVDFADVNNDGHFDALFTNHSSTLNLLINDGNGFFTDVTTEAGLDQTGFFLQAKMVDFDNDGWVDLVYSGGVHKYFKNNGDGTFSEVSDMFPYNDTMHSFGIGDLNHDGFLDLYASYGNTYVNPDSGNPDILWMNDGNDNNWVAFDLQGTTSNMNAVGAKVSIYGDWGIQVREVRAGESYGIVNSFHCHFGLGSSTSIDQAIVEWPSGIVTVIDNPGTNVYHSVIEAECQIAAVEIQASGSLTLCPGESVTLTAPEGFNYTWSNGANTQSIDVTDSGAYSVIVSDDEGCAGGSNNMIVNLITPTVPTISVNGDLELCEGQSVNLISSAGESYLWSNGEESQSIEVSESGSYTVSVVDECDSGVQSEVVEIVVYEAPAPIVDEAITIAANSDQLIVGEGSELHWFDAEDAVDPLFIGNEMPVNLSESTVFWVEDHHAYGGVGAQGGQESFTEDGGQHHTNSSFWLVFDAHQDMVLESVKVFAGNEGERTIAVVDANNVTVQSLTVNIPEGEQIVALNFEIPEGEGYGLRSLDDNPQLWRDGPPAALAYPYELGDIATITTSSVSGANALSYYYFFYDWQVATPTVECVSERVQVNVTVSGIDELSLIDEIKLYPNPAREQLTLELSSSEMLQAGIEITDLSGRAVLRQDFRLVPGLNRQVLDVAALASGMYNLTILTPEGRFTEKLLID